VALVVAVASTGDVWSIGLIVEESVALWVGLNVDVGVV